MPSVHDEQRPWSQRPPVQSEGLAHIFRSAHLGQAEPPQSTSLSPWFVTRSVQVGAAHLPAAQTALEQSVKVRQVLPGKQGRQPPPQSTSTSLPFMTPSTVQARSSHLPALQRPLLQSWAIAQDSPAAQPRQLPPQSTPVSLPLRT